MFAGTPRYAAPEQMFGQRSEASDWYALGVMLYEALTGELPFTAKDQMELLRQKQQEDPPQLAGRDDLPRRPDATGRRADQTRTSPAAIADAIVQNSWTWTPRPAHVVSSATAGSAGSHASSDSQASEMDQEDLDRLAAEEQELILVGREAAVGRSRTTLSRLLRIGPAAGGLDPGPQRRRKIVTGRSLFEADPGRIARR